MFQFAFYHQLMEAEAADSFYSLIVYIYIVYKKIITYVYYV